MIGLGTFSEIKTETHWFNYRIALIKKICSKVLPDIAAAGTFGLRFPLPVHCLIASFH